jgi:hypothetical protein
MAGRPLIVGNTPEGIDLYGYDHGGGPRDEETGARLTPKGYVEAGYLDVGENQAGGRISVPVFIKESDKKANDANTTDVEKRIKEIEEGKSGFGKGTIWDNIYKTNQKKQVDELRKKLDSENPQAGLLQDLFNKSGDEIERLEGGDPAKKAPVEEAAPVEESEEDKRIRERIRQFRKQEGRDPDTGKIAGILNEGEFDEFALGDEPALHPLQGEDEASPQEERQLMQVVQGSADTIFGDKMSAFINQLKSGSSQGGKENLYDPASFAVMQVLLLQKQELEKTGEKAEPAVFFAESGAVPLVTDMVFDLAKQLQLPGADDQDQYAATIINVFKMAGEHVLDAKDAGAIDEATRVATNMVEIGMGGEQVPAEPVKNKVSQGIDEALLGGVA